MRIGREKDALPFEFREHSDAAAVGGAVSLVNGNAAIAATSSKSL